LTHVIQQQSRGGLENKASLRHNPPGFNGEFEVNLSDPRGVKESSILNISQSAERVLRREVDPRYRRLLSVLSIPALQTRQRRFESMLEVLRVGTPAWTDAVDRHQAILDEFANRQLTAPFRGCFTPTNPDMHGRAHNPTRADQDVLAVIHPVDAFAANTAANDAHTAGSSSGMSGTPWGPRDAFRHCVWSCFMAQRIGQVRAEQFGTGHENQDPGYPLPLDRQMDLHNNVVGRRLGSPGADCGAACIEAVRSGRLRTIRGPFTRPQANPPLTIPCIGASNQPWP